MRYYPVSVVLSNPLLPVQYTADVHVLRTAGKMSHPLFRACQEVIAHMPDPGDDPLVIIESVGAPMRRAYITPPTFWQFARLERGGFHKKNGYCGFMIDAVH